MSRNVAIYARVSTEHEAQLSALENQVQYYDDILKQHPDWTLYDRYIDEGITGTSTKKRKNFMRMMADAENGCFDLIITREVSRFARNTVDTLQETRKLKRIGVEVFFTEDNIWTFNDEDGELKLTIMATLAQNESKKTSQRVKAGQKISFENGVFYGNGNILGYDKVGSDMVINEEQSKTVRYIYDRFLKGIGTTDIKYELEKMGALTPTGLKKWSPSYISRILHNPFYCGTIVYRKSYIPDYLEQKAKKNNGEVEQVIVEGTHVPIVTKEEFEKVQNLFKEKVVHIVNGKKKATGVPKNIWSKKLKCECGSSFNRRTYHKKATGDTYCYVCYNQKANGTKETRLKRGLSVEDACDTPLVQDWKLKAMANFLFQNLWNNREELIDVINKYIDETITDKDNCNENEEKIKSIESKIRTNKTKLDNLLDMCLNGYISRDDYLNKKEELENNIKDLKTEKEKIESNYKIPKDVLKARINNLKQLVKKHIGSKHESISDEMIEESIESVIVHKDRFEWKLSYLNDIIDLNINNRQGKATTNNLYVEDVKLVPQIELQHKLQSKQRRTNINDKRLGKTGLFCMFGK
ncbi:MAG: recombinase family protein [Bacilli bacterium]|nr:recombinase family protein [Bacilli bacterium]